MAGSSARPGSPSRSAMRTRPAIAVASACTRRCASVSWPRACTAQKASVSVSAAVMAPVVRMATSSVSLVCGARTMGASSTQASAAAPPAVAMKTA